MDKWRDDVKMKICLVDDNQHKGPNWDFKRWNVDKERHSLLKILGIGVEKSWRKIELVVFRFIFTIKSWNWNLSVWFHPLDLSRLDVFHLLQKKRIKVELPPNRYEMIVNSNVVFDNFNDVKIKSSDSNISPGLNKNFSLEFH